jgi:hypothetical protein
MGMNRNEYIGHPEPHDDEERAHLAYLTGKLGAERVKNEQKRILVQFRLWGPLMNLPIVKPEDLSPEEKQSVEVAARQLGKEYAEKNLSLIVAQHWVLGL